MPWAGGGGWLGAVTPYGSTSSKNYWGKPDIRLCRPTKVPREKNSFSFRTFGVHLGKLASLFPVFVTLILNVKFPTFPVPVR